MCKNILCLNRSVEMPEWLSSRIPKIEQCGLLGYDYDEDIFWVKNELDNTMSYYPSAHAAVENNSNLSIDDSVSGTCKVINNCMVLSNSSSVIVVKNDNDKFEKLKREWNEWCKVAEKVDNNNASWQDSYLFVETFPLLWQPILKTPTFSWLTRNGHDYIEHGLDNDEFYLSINIEGTGLNSDGFVSVSTDSIDKAYILLAKELMTLVSEKS